MPMDATSHSRKIDVLLNHYGSSHTHPTNEHIHMWAIPAIMLSLVGLIYALHPLAAGGFLLASLVYYLRLNRVFFIAMLLGSAGLMGLVTALHASGFLLSVCLTVFVIAWIFQFIGHKIEGKKPSFFEDIQYLWVGPLFVLSKVFQRFGIRW